MDRKRIVDFDDAPGFSEFRFQNLTGDEIARLQHGAPSAMLHEPIAGSCEQEDHMIDLAIRRMEKAGVDYGDLRLGNDISRRALIRDENIAHHNLQRSSGIGVRVLVKGFWGFAATPDLSDQGIAECVDRAVALGKGVAAVTPRDLGVKREAWAEEPAHVAEFHTPVAVCPMEASVETFCGDFRDAASIGLQKDGIKRVIAYVLAFARRRIFANTDGANILTTHCITDGQQRFYAVKDGQSCYRTNVHTALAGGLEHMKEYDYASKASAAAEDALLKCSAQKPADGSYDLILDGHNLALTMHESVGHPTELDRVLGYELSMAGGSFAQLDKLNTFRYGSPIVNFTANNRVRFGGASQGYDDEGVECRDFPVIREGILVGYGNNRETAHVLGESQGGDGGDIRANGTCRATGWHDAPIVRIPNLFLEPGRDQLSREDLIADTKDGILMLGRDSFSIDQMRLNFQFGADMCYRVRNGKIAEPLRDVIYQSMTPQFWNACDAICDETEWQMHGVMFCGKGQPVQSGKMMHGASPARFRQIKVGY